MVCFNICSEFIYVKNACLDEGTLGQCSAYFTEDLLLWKKLVCFPAFWLYLGLWIKSQMVEKTFLPPYFRRFLSLILKYSLSFMEALVEFSRQLYILQNESLSFSVSSTSLYDFIYHAIHSCFPCVHICILVKGWERLLWELLPAII